MMLGRRNPKSNAVDSKIDNTSVIKKTRPVLGTINTNIPINNRRKLIADGKENKTVVNGGKKPLNSDKFNENLQPPSNKDLNKKPIAIPSVESSGDKAVNPRLPGDWIKRLDKLIESIEREEKQNSTRLGRPGITYLPPPQKQIQVPVQPTNSAKKTKSFLASLDFATPAQDCHPEAWAYRSDYKNKKDELAKYLFQYYNKEVFDGKLPNDTELIWEPKYLKKAGTSSQGYKVDKNTGVLMKCTKIRLSTKYLDTAHKLRCTLIHEMCHAAVWLIDNCPIKNVKDCHGPEWRKWTDLAMKRFPELPPITQYAYYKMQTKFTYKCLACGHCIGRHSKSLDIKIKRCDRCNGQLELLLNRTTRSGRLRSPIPIKEKPVTGFALYVKENFHKVSEDHGDVKPTEVMKLLAKQFTDMKIAK